MLKITEQEALDLYKKMPQSSKDIIDRILEAKQRNTTEKELPWKTKRD